MRPRQTRSHLAASISADWLNATPWLIMPIRDGWVDWRVANEMTGNKWQLPSNIFTFHAWFGSHFTLTATHTQPQRAPLRWYSIIIIITRECEREDLPSTIETSIWIVFGLLSEPIHDLTQKMLKTTAGRLLRFSVMSFASPPPPRVVSGAQCDIRPQPPTPPKGC